MTNIYGNRMQKTTFVQKISHFASGQGSDFTCKYFELLTVGVYDADKINDILMFAHAKQLGKFRL